MTGKDQNVTNQVVLSDLNEVKKSQLLLATTLRQLVEQSSFVLSQLILLDGGVRASLTSTGIPIAPINNSAVEERLTHNQKMIEKLDSIIKS